MNKRPGPEYRAARLSGWAAMPVGAAMTGIALKRDDVQVATLFASLTAIVAGILFVWYVAPELFRDDD